MDSLNFYFLLLGLIGSCHFQEVPFLEFPGVKKCQSKIPIGHKHKHIAMVLVFILECNFVIINCIYLLFMKELEYDLSI
jgi:hypothetical protein